MHFHFLFVNEIMLGNIITMGGSVDLVPDTPLFKEYFNLAQKITPNAPMIGVIPSGSANPRKSGEAYRDLFESMGANTVLINPQDRVKANSKEMISKAETSDAYFFGGGHQLRITALLGGTKLLKKIKEKFKKGAMIGGTSAGSVCLTTIMISQDLIKRPLVHGEVEVTHGLGFIEDIIIDTHFSTRNRIPRLIHVVGENPGVLGVGLGENTGAVWDFEKKEFRVIGRESVVVIEGTHITKNNTPDLELGESISVSGITVHVMGEGAIFQYEDCELTLPPRSEDSE